MRLGNKCSYIYFILINPYPISLFSDSPCINQLLQITRKVLLPYTSEASHFRVSQFLKGTSIGARHGGSEQGLCFTKWNLSGEGSPLSYSHFSMSSQMNQVKALGEVSVLSFAFDLGPAQEMHDMH